MQKFLLPVVALHILLLTAPSANADVAQNVCVGGPGLCRNVACVDSNGDPWNHGVCEQAGYETCIGTINPSTVKVCTNPLVST